MSQVIRTLRRCTLFFVALLLVSQTLQATTANAQDALKAWENFDFAKRTIQPAQLKDLNEYDLKLLRGLVFGRRGRIFKDPDIKNYLQERAWYKPDPQFQNTSLNAKERSNLDVIRIEEAKRHEQIEPGDMRLYQTRLVTAKQLGQHTGAEWRVLRAEIEAIHGRRFDDQPWLQQYFAERYWYKPNDAYNPKQLSSIERRNLATIDAAQKKQRNVAISAGDMELFQKTPVKEEMLRGLGLYELRLLRNEVYARRGRQFRTAWLAQFFYSQPWYEPSETFQDTDLTDIEKQNIETIAKYENRLKEELSAKPVAPTLLEGLFLEDARKLRFEIQARHGKVFKDKWVQDYFVSFPWYKPNPQYQDTMLTTTEQRNVAAILAYEKKATSVLDAIEG